MRIPSPDALLIGLFEAAFAGPQGRGVPLPALLALVEFAPSAGCVTVGLAGARTNSTALTLCWAGMAAAFGAYAFREALVFVRDARTWDEAKARFYRGLALRMRVNLVTLRAVFLVILAGLLAACGASAAFRGIAHQGTLDLAAYAALAAGFLSMLLGNCVMPRDPDLREPFASPQAA